MKRFGIIPLAVLAFTPLTGTTAQERPPVEPGARIRITAPSVFSDRIVGTVVSWESEQLVLAGCGKSRVMDDSIASRKFLS